MAKYTFTACAVVDTTTGDVTLKFDGECLTRKGGVLSPMEIELFKNRLFIEQVLRSSKKKMLQLRGYIDDTFAGFAKVSEEDIPHLQAIQANISNNVFCEFLDKEDFLMTEANEGFA